MGCGGGKARGESYSARRFKCLTRGKEVGEVGGDADGRDGGICVTHSLRGEMNAECSVERKQSMVRFRLMRWREYCYAVGL